MPKNMRFTDAATLPFGGMTALHFVREAQLKNGDRVLIGGGAGAVGNMLVQLAKYCGAHVTATASKRNLPLLQELGADKVMDYAGNELETSQDPYDVIFDTAGKTPVSVYKKKLKPGGRLVLVAANAGQILQAMLLAMTGRLKLSAGMTRETYEYMQEITRLADAGYLRPVKDRVMPLEAIAEAHRLTQSGQKTGTIAISVTE
jgi:NADPH:quinone reductase-like Zn-dependent oxidoreductase